MGKILEFEFLRGFAAFYVFFHHTVFQFNIIEKNSILGKLFSFGQEAVMLFFLLSGYVIALSLMKRKYSFYEYLKHRFLRIYPIPQLRQVFPNTSSIEYILLQPDCQSLLKEEMRY